MSSSAAAPAVFEVLTPSGSRDFRASWVALPPEVPGRLLAGPWPCDKSCNAEDKERVMRALLGPAAGVRTVVAFAFVLVLGLVMALVPACASGCASP